MLSHNSMQVLQSLLPGSGGCTSANGNGKDGKPAVCDSRHSKDVSKRDDKPQVGAYTPPALLSGAGHDALKLAELTKVPLFPPCCLLAADEAHHCMAYSCDSCSA